jgi:hypothetical protein
MYSGYIERHSNQHGLSGWCVYEDPALRTTDKPVDILVYAGDILLRKISTVGYRDGILNSHGVSRSGFALALTPEVLACIPEGTMLSLRDREGNELALQLGKQVAPLGQATDGGAALLDHFAKGMIIDKWGSLKLPFSAKPEQRSRYMEAMLAVQDLFASRLSLTASPAYGTLLGMARNGRFIDHDDDVDLMVELPYSTLETMVQNLYDGLAVLHADGHQLSLVSPGQFHVTLKDSDLPDIDMFLAWQEPDDTFYTHFGVGGMLDGPLSYQYKTLEGHSVLAASCFERILELSYGPHWLVPDPDFQWSVPKTVQKRMDDLDAAAKGPAESLKALLAEGGPKSLPTAA